jgi:hypothetical protein
MCKIWEWRWLFSFEVVIVQRVTAETVSHCRTSAPATVPRVNCVFTVVIIEKHRRGTSVRNRNIWFDKNGFWLVQSTTVTVLLTSNSAKQNITWKIFVRGSTLSWAFRHLDKFCPPSPSSHHRSFPQQISIGKREKEANWLHVPAFCKFLIHTHTQDCCLLLPLAINLCLYFLNVPQ